MVLFQVKGDDKSLIELHIPLAWNSTMHILSKTIKMWCSPECTYVRSHALILDVPTYIYIEGGKRVQMLSTDMQKAATCSQKKEVYIPCCCV